MSNSGIDPFQRVGDITERYRVEIAEQLIEQVQDGADYIDDPEMPRRGARTKDRAPENLAVDRNVRRRGIPEGAQGEP